jgi:hypothetical protein
LFPLFATSKFTNSVIDSNGNFATSVKIAIGINDTSGTTVVHLDLQISQLIFKKILK